MLHKRSIKEKLLKGGAWAIAGKVTTAVTGLAVNALLARLLEPKDMGAYFLILSLVTVAAVVAQMGLTQTVVRLVAESMAAGRPARARLVVQLCIRATFFGALIVAAVVAFGGGEWLVGKFFRLTIMSQTIALSAVWIVIVALRQLMAEVFRGFHDIRLATAFSGLIAGVITMLLLLGLWLLQGYSDLDQVIVLTVVAGFSSVFLSSLFMRKKLTILPAPLKAELSMSELMGISLPLWITVLSYLLLNEGGIWILGIFRNPEEVAIYGAVIKTAILVTVPLLILNSVVSPIISQMNEEGRSAQLEKVLRGTTTMIALPSFLISCVFIFYGGPILGHIYGSFYQQGGTMLMIMSIGQVIGICCGSPGLVLTMTGYQMTLLKIAVLTGLVGITFSFLLVQRFGGEGVVFCMSFSMAFSKILALFTVKNKLNIWTHVDLTRLDALVAQRRLR